jgi:hypothetical protein
MPHTNWVNYTIFDYKNYFRGVFGYLFIHNWTQLGGEDSLWKSQMYVTE